MYEIKVTGIHCMGCASSIDNALKKADPQAKVKVDIEHQTVRVESQKPQAEIAAVIEKSGFPVVDAKQLG